MLVCQGIISVFLISIKLKNFVAGIIILWPLTNIRLSNHVCINNNIGAFNQHGIKRLYLHGQKAKLLNLMKEVRHIQIQI